MLVLLIVEVILIFLLNYMFDSWIYQEYLVPQSNDNYCSQNSIELIFIDEVHMLERSLFTNCTIELRAVTWIL